MSKKILQSKYPNSKISKTYFKPYDYTITKENTIHHIKVLNVTKNAILSINSKYVWEIRYGRPNGINFRTSSKVRLDMTDFNKLENKIIVFKDKPYKILKYINESEVVDISTSNEVFDIRIFNTLNEIDV